MTIPLHKGDRQPYIATFFQQFRLGPRKPSPFMRVVATSCATRRVPMVCATAPPVAVMGGQRYTAIRLPVLSTVQSPRALVRKPAASPYRLQREGIIATEDPGRPLTYRDAGVDVDAGARLVEAIAPLARGTRRTGTDGLLGGFGGVFDLAACGYRDPLLVAATDGVGTKLRIAIDTGRHDTVGVDLVAMCVNDLVAQGAEPLFFLDYYATGTLSLEQARSVIAGIARGCRTAGCALLGGETAEMPGIYGGSDYDLAGFAVGAVERDALIDGSAAAAGDVVLGLASSGVHANGLSLVRRVLERAGLDPGEPAPFDRDRSLAEVMLEPTRIYVAGARAAMQAGTVTGIAHITGGGLIDNPPRAFGAGLAVDLDCTAWPVPPVFGWLARTGGIQARELARTFNCGIGLVITVRPGDAAAVTRALAGAGERVFEIGRLRRREADTPAVRLGSVATLVST